MIDEIVGQIDINTCAQIIADSFQQNLVPLGIALAVLAIAFVITALLWINTYNEARLLKDFLRRKKALNDFEDWKKERTL
jgi:ABC-type spermidine/putrescine transport system permease subunit I